MISLMTQTLVQAVDQAAADLASVQHREGESFVSTPLVLPSGSTVVVRISNGAGTYSVSDFGVGRDEAETLGTSNFYARIASEIAERTGIEFDGNAFHVSNVEFSRVAGAIMSVANSALEAAILVARKSADRRGHDDAERLYQRLISIFPKKYVAKNAEIIGWSTTSWHVTSLVEVNKSNTIFDSVGAHHASIFAATAKFYDISRLENPPRRVAVVGRKHDLHSYLGVLSQAASVIEGDAPLDILRRLAEAA